MKKILIVEDEPMLVRALKYRCAGVVETLIAPDGAIGLEMAKQTHPDFIVLDLLMPKMDGIEMLKSLRKNKWGKTVKVMVLTNLSNDEKHAEALKLGVVDYLMKTDWTVDEIIDKIKNKLGI
jgi:DNA-binding response OmpR family regulator